MKQVLIFLMVYNAITAVFGDPVFITYNFYLAPSLTIAPANSLQLNGSIPVSGGIQKILKSVMEEPTSSKNENASVGGVRQAATTLSATEIDSKEGHDSKTTPISPTVENISLEKTTARFISALVSIFKQFNSSALQQGLQRESVLPTTPKAEPDTATISCSEIDKYYRPGLSECDRGKGYCVATDECEITVYNLRCKRCPTLGQICCPKNRLVAVATTTEAMTDQFAQSRVDVDSEESPDYTTPFELPLDSTTLDSPNDTTRKVEQSGVTQSTDERESLDANIINDVKLPEERDSDIMDAPTTTKLIDVIPTPPTKSANNTFENAAITNAPIVEKPDTDKMENGDGQQNGVVQYVKSTSTSIANHKKTQDIPENNKESNNEPRQIEESNNSNANNNIQHISSTKELAPAIPAPHSNSFSNTLVNAPITNAPTLENPDSDKIENGDGRHDGVVPNIDNTNLLTLTGSNKTQNSKESTEIQKETGKETSKEHAGIEDEQK